MGITRKFLTKLRKATQAKIYREKNREALRIKSAVKYERNKEKIKERTKRHRIANAERYKEYDRRRNAVRRIEDASYYRAKTVERRNQLATTTQDIEQLKWIYQIAQDNLMQVDHIVPLRGQLVSGLNVTHNLQLLPPELNQWKHNKFDNDSYQSWRLSNEIGPYLPL
jgi:hypothetical protein